MNCSRFETLLSDYLDGRLENPVQEAVGVHLSSCDKCALLVRQVAALRQDLAACPEVRVRDSLVSRIMEATSGRVENVAFWQDLVGPSLRPFLSPRYAFATLLMFVFLSLAVNMMGPEFSAFSRNPSSILDKADAASTQIYSAWRQFNEFKARVAEELSLLKDDLFGRLDYHLITLLFSEYKTTPDTSSETPQTQGETTAPKEE